ncbi:MAG TPA: trimeric intracellular cation channel family protein [Caulobacteraceae bacterium]|nr:trimeric intracellular cation channel family protein [Caulobacteraceae bacterium]
MAELTALPPILNYAGVALFAATGAMAAAHRRHDVITFAFFAAITGLGGGTLRDLLLGAPVWWVKDPTSLTVAVATGIAVWLLGFREGAQRLLLWPDAIGLAAFAVIGADKAVSLGAAPGVAVTMGVLTAAAGGIIRDVTAGEPSILLQREIYVTAALVAAAGAVFLSPWLGRDAAAAAGFTLGLGLRLAAMVFRWSLPSYFGGLFGHERPGT